MSDLVRDKFIEMAIIFFQKPEEEFKTLCVNCRVPLQIMEQVYRYSLKDGLERIEDLPNETKWRLFNQAKSWNPEGTKDFLTSLSRVIWVREQSKNV